MSARNKIFFGGLPPDEAELAARFAYRGQLDLQKPKHLYDKPVAVDHTPVWLSSESESHGTAEARGTTTTRGGGEAVSHSTTISESETFGESDTTSEASTRSTSEDKSSGSSSSASHTDTQDPNSFDWLTIADSSGSTNSRGSGSGSATADTSGSAHIESHAYSESFAETTSTTESSNWSKGTSKTLTTSDNQTRGRAQSLKPVLKIMPTQGYTLAELIDAAAAEIAGLDQGEAVVKIGKRPAAKVEIIRIRDGWAGREHIEHVKARLAAQTPFVVAVGQTAITYTVRPPALLAPVVAPGGEPIASAPSDEPQPLSPPLKDEGWG